MTIKGRQAADIGHMGPGQGTVSARRRAALVAVAIACVCAALAPTASADESAWPTAQATAYNFAFVPYLDPPPTHAAVCLVDSGVNITPDTPTDSPDGPIVKRLALERLGDCWCVAGGADRFDPGCAGWGERVPV
jgi:hypothetical protein